MALRVLDGFDDLFSYIDVIRRYHSDASGINIATYSGGRFGIGRNIRPLGASLSLYHPIGNCTELYCGIAVKLSTQYSGLLSCLRFYGPGGSYFSIGITFTEIYFCHSTLPTFFTQYTGVNLSTSTWVYLEVKVKISGPTSADGDFQLRVNGLEVFSSSAGFSNTFDQIDAVVLPDSYCYFDDVYICDTEGSINNTFLGPIKIISKPPTGNGYTSQFIGSDSDSTNNYLHVDDTTLDDDSTYIQSNVAGNKDMFTFSSISTSDVASIIGVSVSAFGRITQGGLRTSKYICRSNSTDYESDSIGHDVSYWGQSAFWEVDPDTSSPWTVSDLNSSEFGIKVET